MDGMTVELHDGKVILRHHGFHLVQIRLDSDAPVLLYGIPLDGDSSSEVATGSVDPTRLGSEIAVGDVLIIPPGVIAHISVVGLEAATRLRNADPGVRSMPIAGPAYEVERRTEAETEFLRILSVEKAAPAFEQRHAMVVATAIGGGQGSGSFDGAGSTPTLPTTHGTTRRRDGRDRRDAGVWRPLRGGRPG